MSKKRSAENYLNHENWDDKEESEKPGVFTIAPPEELSKRTVIKARRRNPTGSSSSESLFSSFKGFSNAPSIQPSPGTFDFLKSVNSKPSSDSSKAVETSASPKTPAPPPDLIASKPNTSLNFGSSNTSSNPLLQKPSNSSFFQKSSTFSTAVPPTVKSDEEPAAVQKQTKRMRCEDEAEKSNGGSNKTSEKKSSDSTPDHNEEESSEAHEQFKAKLAQLNVKFVNFVQEKVKSNPFCILFPPIEDYRKYVDKFLKEKLDAENRKKLAKEGFSFKSIPSTEQAGQVTIQNNKSNEIKTFQIGNLDTKNNTQTKDNNFSFSTPASKITPASVDSKPSFSFGLTKSPDFNASTKDLNGTKSPTSSAAFGMSPLFGSKSNGDTKQSTGFKLGSITEENTSKAEESKPKTNVIDSKVESGKPSFSFGKSEAFTWGSNSNVDSKSESSNTKPSFSFGSLAGSSPAISTSTPSPKPAFSFGFAKANSEASTESVPAGGTTEADDEDEPLPKEEIKEVVEEDSIFTIKCKVFVKKSDGSFGDRGVGNLFVKSIEDKVKAQVIVRSTGTSMGNLIFNVIVNKNVTILLDKNNLKMSCIPYPTTDKNPTPTLCIIRVKTAQDAEDLLQCLEKFKS